LNASAIHCCVLWILHLHHLRMEACDNSSADDIATVIGKILIKAFTEKEGREPTSEEIEMLFEEMTEERIESLLNGAGEPDQEGKNGDDGDSEVEEEEDEDGECEEAKEKDKIGYAPERAVATSAAGVSYADKQSSKGEAVPSNENEALNKKARIGEMADLPTTLTSE
jgi:hypothetical protein